MHTWPTDPKRKEKFEDKATGLEMEAAEEPQSLLEWLAEHYKEFGCALEFVSDKSQEGSQFVKGFSGIGGILRFVLYPDVYVACADGLFHFRYKVDSATLMNDSDFEDDEFYGSDSDSGMSSDPVLPDRH